jgi:protoheme IX farnesyltransferase
LAPALVEPVSRDFAPNFPLERSLSPAPSFAPVARPAPARLAANWTTSARDYLELTKPKIAILELVTIAVSAWLASGGRLSLEVVHALAGTALVAASASALNQWLEKSSDARMRRTANRPLPAGRLSDGEVFGFALATGLTGLVWLAMFVGGPTAALGLAAWFLYVAIYTPLKRLTPWNTAVGAVAGALPVAIGWSAAGGAWSATLVGLVALVFLWQFPHFMAIAWMYRREYEAAGLKMLPVVDPTGRRAGRQAVGCAALLVFVGVWTGVAGGAGIGFAAWSLLLGAGQLTCAWLFARRLDQNSARLLLRASLVYLPAVLAGLLLASGAPLLAPPT